MTKGNPTNERSQRTPGYRYRPVDATNMEQRAADAAHQYDTHGDGEVGIPEQSPDSSDQQK